MRHIATSLILASMMGCAHSQPRLYDYRPKMDLRISICTKLELRHKCADAVQFDNGVEIDNWNRDRIAGCYDPLNKIIYVSEWYPWALINEICHFAGYEPGECRKNYHYAEGL